MFSPHGSVDLIEDHLFQSDTVSRIAALNEVVCNPTEVAFGIATVIAVLSNQKVK
jgi:hypothetical protein